MANPDKAGSLRLMVNGEVRVGNSITLGDLLAEMGYGGQRVATAVNGEFVAAPERADHRLAEGDSVEIVAPRQGG